MMYLYTKPPQIFFKDAPIYYAKQFARRILRKKRGPGAVIQSLQRGLTNISISFFINKKLNNTTAQKNIVHVVSNIQALYWAIKQKELGHIHKLVVGPNLVIMPYQYDSILAHPAIDAILLPSTWTKDFYGSLLPTIKDKIYIWPAGVQIPPVSNKKRNGCIVFKKDVPEAIYQSVIHELRQKNISFTVLLYGSYSQSEYFSLLEQSEYMIYLQKVESQGLALQEAWARNVPTLVWNAGSFTYPTGETVHGNIAAPFQTEQTGLFFTGTQDFSKQIEVFKEKLQDLTPREYCIAHLSDEASAKTYVKIVENLQ